MNINFGLGVFFFLFVLFWWLLSKLIGAILESPRLQEKHWIIVGALNAVIILYVASVWSNALLSYYAMVVALILSECIIFYRDRFLSALLCTLACSIHLIAVFMVTLGASSLYTGLAPHEILTSERAFLWCSVASFFLLDIVIVGVARFVPLPKVKLINQHKEQQWFIIAWVAVSSLLLVYMGSLFNNASYPVYLSGSQIAASLTLLIGFYIVLFFAIKTNSILGYKEKNAELEQAIYQEQQYRNFMVRDAIVSYEFNMTQDLILKGFEGQYNDQGELVYGYDEVLVLLSQKLIYSEDIAGFLRNYGRGNILRLFEKGEREFIAEYRRLLETGEYVWVRSITTLVQNRETGDIKAFVCVKNIDEEKKNQLELLRRAERDPLTGLYNRSTASKLIDEYIAFGQSHSGSALFMIDVDNFKEINDNLGHIYGDAVLCELADKLTRIFRQDDIVGRIGGDEYIVFLKEGATVQTASAKAEEICRAFHVTYQGNDCKKYVISSSVGISLFSRDGKEFKELYANADTALYAAKSAGKNGYKFYDGSSFAGYSAQRTEIQMLGNISQKGFRENRIEYVFKMLYQSENPVLAIHSVLELVANHFSFERGYIFETSKDGKFTSNTFEWCAEGVAPQIDNLQNVPIEVVATAHASFQRSGTFILKSLDELKPIERDVLEPQGIKAMFQFGIFDKSNLLGFIGFDNCRREEVPSDVDIDEMKTICNILATFFVKQYIDEASSKDLLARQEVMNHLEEYIYVINIETFELLFMNEKIQKILENSGKETACYSFFRGKSAQCDDCPMRRLIYPETNRVVAEVYNDKMGFWMESSVTLMQWTDGSQVCLIACADITSQKEAHLNHVRELEQLIYVDALTGCPTYHKFQMDAQRILANQLDKMHCLVKLDVANFKLINQIYGYERGNEVLCFVAKAIEQTIRGENEVFARVNNDEFIVLFTIAQKAEIEKLNKNFIDNFQRLIGNDFSFKFNFPNGRYLIEPADVKKMDVKDMFEKANIAHKAAKLDKTVSFLFYDDNMTKEALRVKEIENKMSNALINNEFSVYLQPKYRLENETIGGAEALTRWKNENVDLFFPSTFIPVFEQNGFITKMDLYVFEKVCHVIKSWVDDGIEPVKVSTNFSRLHLDNVNFVSELCEIADRVGVDRKYLEIEITETVIFDNINILEVLLKEIHHKGFSMSMDDFGKGYSSLGMLKNLPVDVIKMDRSFFVDQRDIERSKTVVGSVIQMAASLGIRIVAEGVEKREHIDFLRGLNCDMVQGYYYARPMPVDLFTDLLRKEKSIAIEQ